MGKMMVTVFCMTYNHKDYIRNALDGFVSQKTNFDFEVLVHDDASTDGTAEIVREYEKKYPSIIKGIYQKENTYRSGINRLYTFLLPKAEGKYIALCEGDDFWCCEDKLQLQVDYMETHPECALVAHEAMKLYSNGELTKYTKYSFESNGELSVYQVIKQHLLFPVGSMLFPAEFLIENKDFFMKYHMYDYLLKALLATQGKVHVIPKVMSVYRVSSVGSWTEEMKNDTEKYIRHEENAIKSLEALDEYTQYKYHDDIEDNLLKRKYHIEELKGNFSVLTKYPYRKYYQEGSLKYRLLIRLANFFPGLYKLALRIFKK